MDALSAAYDSDGSSGEETSQQKDELPPIDAEESSSVLSRLKERFPFNSAPAVPIRVRKHPMRVNWNRFPTCLRKIRMTCCEWVQTQRKSRKIPQLSNYAPEVGLKIKISDFCQISHAVCRWGQPIRSRLASSWPRRTRCLVT